MRCTKIYLLLILILGLTDAELRAQSPVVSIDSPGSKSEFCINQTVTLTARINIAPDEVSSISWNGDHDLIDKNFGDVLVLRLRKPGKFTYTVTVNDIYDNKHTCTTTINVSDVIKPVLKLEGNMPLVILKDTKLLRNITYYIDNREVSDGEFKAYSQPGTYWVITTTKNGCSASSNTLVVKK